MSAELSAVQNLVKLLQQCRRTKNLPYAKVLYSYMRDHALDSHPVLGNHLVQALADSGGLLDARRVFDNLVHRSAQSWNSLLMGYLHCGQPHHTLLLHHKMLQVCVQPNHFMYVPLLKACSQLKDVECGRGLHIEIIKQGLERDLFVGSMMLDMYGKCGSLAEACHVFDKAPSRDVVLWNGHIAALIEHGLVEEALRCYEQMELEGLSAGDATFVYALKACGCLGSVKRGRQLCAEIFRRGLETDSFLSSTMVDMYIKCYLLHEAQELFSQLSTRNVVTWNALMSGYIDHGYGEEALNCFEQSLSECISPDNITYACSLRACGIIGASEKGKCIHIEVIKRGLEKDIHVGTTLMGMYAKCDCHAEAHEVFDCLPGRDAVSWAALISGYVERGYVHEVLQCFKEMHMEGMSPLADSLAWSLKACTFTGALEEGQELHAEISKRGFEKELNMGTTLVDMYAKCGLLIDARKVFDKLQNRDAVSWAAIISGYTDSGHSDQALNFYIWMHLEGVSPNVDLYACTLKSCGLQGASDMGHDIHNGIIIRGLERELFVSTALVDMYAKCGSLNESQKVFDSLQHQDAVLWTALLAGYTEHELDEEALNCFEKMRSNGASPDANAFACSLKGCGTMGALERGQELHGETTKKGVEGDLFISSTLVDMYANCGCLAEARDIFYKLPSRDVALWNAMMKGYGENHQANMALQCFKEMQEQGVEPNAITFTCVLVACTHACLVLEGHEYFKLMKKEYELEPSVDHYTCMVDLLARSGHVYEAEKFAKGMQCLSSREVLRCLLSACKIHGELEVGLRCFEQLVLLSEDDATAYLLMADLFANASMWHDANRLEEMRMHAEAKKKPGSSLIELSKKLHEFVVGHNKSKNTTVMLDMYSSRMKHEGYIPVLDMVFR